MDFTEQDKAFIQMAKKAGYTKEETFNELMKQKGAATLPKSFNSLIGSPLEFVRNMVGNIKAKEMLGIEIPKPKPVDTGTEGMGFFEKLATAPERGYEKGKQLVEDRQEVEATKTEFEKQIPRSMTSKFLEIPGVAPVLGAIKEPIATVAEGIFDVAKNVPIIPVMMPKIDPETKKMTGVEIFASPKEIWENVKGGVPEPAQEYAANQIVNVAKWYDGLSEETKQSVKETGFIGDFILNVVGGGAGGKLAKKGIEKGAEVAGNVSSKILDKKVLKSIAKETEAITEKIAPGITKKETQLALEQNRLKKGKTGFLGETLTGKKPDVIAPTKKIQETASLIQERIPNASKMTEPELYSAIDKEISSAANGLKGEMKNVLLSNQEKLRIRDKWESLKLEQVSTPEFANAKSGGKAAQKEFERFLGEVEKAPEGGAWTTLDDLWDVAKRYDDTIPKAVKEANELSDPFLQLRKEMWLSNRAVLRDTINDISQGLGDTSKKAFQGMNRMYEANNNILQKVKADVKGKKGFFTAENMIKGTAGYGAIKAIEKGTGIDIPIL